jgi:hypothetical protein
MEQSDWSGKTSLTNQIYCRSNWILSCLNWLGEGIMVICGHSPGASRLCPAPGPGRVAWQIRNVIDRRHNLRGPIFHSQWWRLLPAHAGMSPRCSNCCVLVCINQFFFLLIMVILDMQYRWQCCMNLKLRITTQNCADYR